MPSETELVTCAQYLVAAARAHAEHPTDASADALTAARLALLDLFLAAGWQPPLDRQEQIERDRQLLQEHTGAIDGVGVLEE